MKRVLLLGPVFADIFCRGFEGYPEPGEELFLEGIDVSPGGAAITALTLQNLGIPTELVSVVGKDFFGSYILDYLRENHRNTDYILQIPEEHTGVSICFASAEDRSFLSRREPDLENYIQSLGEMLSSRNLPEVEYLHANFSIIKNEVFRRKILTPLKKEGRLTLLTGLGHEEAYHWKDEDFAHLKTADWFLLNLDEARLISGETELPRMLSRLSEWVAHPVITLGAEGSVTIDETDEIVRRPSIKVMAKNPSGSGDSFTAGLIFGLIRGESYRDSLLLGNITGALATESIYPFNQAINEDQLLRLFEKESILRRKLT
jgi:sugar/nucleoside kinase (ribokinase family)